MDGFFLLFLFFFTCIDIQWICMYLLFSVLFVQIVFIHRLRVTKNCFDGVLKQWAEKTWSFEVFFFLQTCSLMGDDEQRHRVVFMGAGRVGKTSIIRRFLQNSFSAAYRETVEDLHCKDYNIQGTSVKVDFLDTSGDLAFPAMRRLSISTVSLIFDLFYCISIY